MAVVRMKYINIMGPVRMFDGFVLENIINKDIQIEPSYKTIRTHGLVPLRRILPDRLKKRMQILNEKIGAKVETFDQDSLAREVLGDFDIGEMNSFIETLEKRFDEHKSAMANLKTEIRERSRSSSRFSPFRSLKWIFMRCSASAL